MQTVRIELEQTKNGWSAYTKLKDTTIISAEDTFEKTIKSQTAAILNKFSKNLKENASKIKKETKS